MRTQAKPQIHHEALPDVLDELASMFEQWSRNRTHGRTPHHLRAAIMETMREAVSLERVTHSAYVMAYAIPIQ